MQDKDALVIVDVQNDFCPGGALPVAAGDEVIPVLNGYIERFRKRGLPIFATRDWHPERTTHFNTDGGPWPPHCIRGTRGAEFHPDLALRGDALIVSKGMGADAGGYSGFQAVDTRGVTLAELLSEQGIERIFVGGLATDYCVKQTVLDGLKQGFKVILIKGAVRGVNLEPGDSEQAIHEMVRAGAQTSTES